MIREWKVGDFAMKGNGPVQISKELAPGRFRVDYVTNYEKGVGICCGGSSFAWGPEAFTPITDAETIILCNAYAAKMAIEAAHKEIMKQEKVFEANVAALTALKAARESAAVEAQGSEK